MRHLTQALSAVGSRSRVWPLVAVVAMCVTVLAASTLAIAARASSPAAHPGIRSVTMCGERASDDDLSAFTSVLADAAAQAASLEELEMWLRSQPCIVSVVLDDYLIKTLPPQRQFRVELRMADGLTTVKAIDVAVPEGGALRFRSLHDL
jgi:hypothetical protein